jgi:hypothetical protein
MACPAHSQERAPRRPQRRSERRADQHSRSTFDHVVDLADLLVFRNCPLPDGSRKEFAAGDHTGADLHPADVHRVNLLIHDVIRKLLVPGH